MSKKESLIEMQVKCAGEILASILVRKKDQNKTDNIVGYVDKICEGCQQWDPMKLAEAESIIRELSIAEHGTDAPSVSGINPDRIHLLEVAIVNFARFSNDPKETGLIVCSCTPIDCK